MNAVLNRDELIGALKIISCAADKDNVSKVKTASFILLENNLYIISRNSFMAVQKIINAERVKRHGSCLINIDCLLPILKKVREDRITLNYERGNTVQIFAGSGRYDIEAAVSDSTPLKFALPNEVYSVSGINKLLTFPILTSSGVDKLIYQCIFISLSEDAARSFTFDGTRFFSYKTDACVSSGEFNMVLHTACARMLSHILKDSETYYVGATKDKLLIINNNLTCCINQIGIPKTEPVSITTKIKPAYSFRVDAKKLLRALASINVSSKRLENSDALLRAENGDLSLYSYSQEVSSKAVIHLSDSQVNIPDFIYNSNYLTEYVSKCTGDIKVNICKDGKLMP